MPSGPSDNAAVPDNSSKTYNAWGYQGAYDSVQRFVRDYKQLPAKVAAFVPLTFAAGEAYQFDWSEEEVEIGGVVQRVKAAHFRLTHSRQPFVMVFPRETQEMLFAAHDAAFHYWGGVAPPGHLRQPQDLHRPGARG